MGGRAVAATSLAGAGTITRTTPAAVAAAFAGAGTGAASAAFAGADTGAFAATAATAFSGGRRTFAATATACVGAMACTGVGRGNRPLRLRLRLGFGAGLRLRLRFGLGFRLGRFGLNDIGGFVLPFHWFDLRALFRHGLGRLRFGLFRFGRFGRGLLRRPGRRLVFGYGVATRTAAPAPAANLAEINKAQPGRFGRQLRRLNRDQQPIQQGMGSDHE